MDAIFETPIRTRRIIIVFDYLSQSEVKLSHSGSLEIYTFNQLSICRLYVQLISKDIIRVIIIHHSMEKTLETMKFLSQFQDLTEVETRQSDWPLKFELLIALPPDSLGENVLSEMSLSTQQHLRYIALKHRGSLVSLENMDQFIANPDALVTTKSAYPIFNRSTNTIDPLHVHLYVPKGWDSWKKISLVSSSVIGGTAGVYKTESEITQLNQHYGEFLSLDDRSILLGLKTNNSKSLSEPIADPIPEPHSLSVPTFDDILNRIKVGTK